MLASQPVVPPQTDPGPPGCGPRIQPVVLSTFIETVGQAIDAIQAGNKPDLLPLCGAILLAAILRLGLTMVRRIVAGKVSLSVEFDLRRDLYTHLQRQCL